MCSDFSILQTSSELRQGKDLVMAMMSWCVAGFESLGCVYSPLRPGLLPTGVCICPEQGRTGCEARLHPPSRETWASP